MKVAEPPATEIVIMVHCGGAVYVGEIVVVLEEDDWLVVLGKVDGLELDEDDTIVEVEEEFEIDDDWVLVLVLVVIELDVDSVGLLVD